MHGFLNQKLQAYITVMMQENVDSMHESHKSEEG